MIPWPLWPHIDQWPIRKVLTLSDVDTNHPFLPLARKLVEDHILVHWTPKQRELLRNEEQVNLNARDVDTNDLYVMKLRWRGNYYNLIGKWGKIIRGKGLGVGKEIKIRWANGCLLFSVPYDHPVVPTSIPMIQHQQEQWPIRKALTLSDVDKNHPFLTLPGKLVEDHILLYWGSQAREQLRNDLQINVNVRDYDTGVSFLMKLKCCGSYYNLIGKWGQIIRGKGLQVGQEIRVRWDNGLIIDNWRSFLRALKMYPFGTLEVIDVDALPNKVEPSNVPKPEETTVEPHVAFENINVINLTLQESEIDDEDIPMTPFKRKKDQIKITGRTMQ
ncbi:B3 DNA binding domain-containing protein [Tanacetum coccineum]|uniref:B3 DNA binding domain-containing protein n=1 Tax=Tanacetum coccineum TaxID=301880 RepID=A0ABQ5H9T4_9ASTR